MSQNGSLMIAMTVLNLFTLIETDTGKLPLPQHVHMESTNMEHLLKWSPLQISCHPVTYSVQYQGFFELLNNGSWEEATFCQHIHYSLCDMTPGLGSDSDYNIRVMAECQGHVSDWAGLEEPFNRRDTNLTVPNMKASVSGDSIHVEFDDLPQTLEVILKHWRKDQELGVVTQRIMVEQSPFHLRGLEAGAMYCLSAQVALHQRSSSSTETQCFPISSYPGSSAPWLQPTIVCVTIVMITGLGFAVFWSMTKCCPALLDTCWPKQPLPDVLLNGEMGVPTVKPLEEIQELCQPVLVLLPAQPE